MSSTGSKDPVAERRQRYGSYNFVVPGKQCSDIFESCIRSSSVFSLMARNTMSSVGSPVLGIKLRHGRIAPQKLESNGDPGYDSSEFLHFSFSFDQIFRPGSVKVHAQWLNST